MRRTFSSLIVFMILCCIVFVGCHHKSTNDRVPKIRLDTDSISIYCEDNDFMVPMEITDQGVVSDVISAVDVSKWEEVSFEEEIPAMPYFCVDFRNGTVITLLNDTAYGNVGTALDVIRDEQGELLSISIGNPCYGPFMFNDGLLEKIMELYLR